MKTKNMNNSKNSFSVMSFNLRFGLADDGENSWVNRQHAFPDLFKKIMPDFIGVQEANNFQSSFVDTLLPFHSFTGMYQNAPEFWQDNLIFYLNKWECLHSKRYFLSETPKIESKLPESKWPRQCIIGLFENNQNRFIHVNTHFDFAEAVQQRSAELVLSFLSDFPKNTPVVITGDFNAPPKSAAHNTFLEKGFHDVFEGNHSCTYHGFTGKQSGEHIDWILYKGDITPGSSEIISEQFADIYPSDHFPVVASFAF